MRTFSSGFSLVELLVALFIASIVAYLVFSTTGIVADSNDRLNDFYEREIHGGNGQDWFTESVQGIILQRNYTPYFVGDESRFSAFTHMRILSNAGGFVDVEWSVRREADILGLYLKEGDEPEKLVAQWDSGIYSARFLYLNERLITESNWSRIPGGGVRVLPEAVIFAISGISGEKQFWLAAIESRKTPPLSLEDL